MLGISLSCWIALLRQAAELRPPPGFVFLVDNDGKRLTDADGAYLIERI